MCVTYKEIKIEPTSFLVIISNLNFKNPGYLNFEKSLRWITTFWNIHKLDSNINICAPNQSSFVHDWKINYLYIIDTKFDTISRSIEP